MSPRHWLHCTTRDHGPRFTAERRTPCVVGTKEPTTPRLCVAETVAQCFAARFFDGAVYVYRTAAPRRAVRPVGVWDWAITGERWLIPPVEMVRTDVILPWTVADCFAATDLYHRETGKHCNVRLRVALYARCIEVLGEKYARPREVRYLSQLRARLGIDGDLDEYVLAMAEQDGRKAAV